MHDADTSATDTTAPTAARLISAAEQLFALHGIDGISLREINRAAEGPATARRCSTTSGTGTGSLRAVMAKHHREVEARRHAMLDAYEAEGRDDVRALAGALVRPLASKLADEDGGAQYLQILADLINRPRPVINPADLDDPTSSIFRWRNLVGRLLEDDATRLHRRFVAIRFAAVELGRRARNAPQRRPAVHQPPRGPGGGCAHHAPVGRDQAAGGRANGAGSPA